MKYKGEKISRNDLKTLKILSNLKIGKSKAKKQEKRRESKFFEAFLLRSFLYKISKEDPNYLEPFLINGNWIDYANSWKIGENVHYPFRGKIAFIVNEKGQKKLVCHPENSAEVDKIIFEPGYLSLLNTPDAKIQARHKAKVCKKILQYCGSSAFINAIDLEKIKNETHINPEGFLFLLTFLGLLKKKDSNYVIDGPHLFCNEISKTYGFSDLEKAARVILRRDVERPMHITTVLLWLEARERTIEPWSESLGIGKKEREYFDLACNETSLNAVVISDILKDFSKFNAFLEHYRRELIGKTGYECYVTLSCHVDSLGLVGAYLENRFDLNDIFKTSFKKEKFERHVNYLLRFIDKKSLIDAINRKDLDFIRRKLVKSEIIDLNISNYSKNITSNKCLSNVFIVSKLPVRDNYFKHSVIETLKTPHIWKHSEGYFYYPDFRFIMSAKMGLTFNAFDRLLAYHIQNDIDFYSKLYLPVLWGIRLREQKIDKSLLSVVPEAFDSIGLKYEK